MVPDPPLPLPYLRVSQARSTPNHRRLGKTLFAQCLGRRVWNRHARAPGLPVKNPDSDPGVVHCSPAAAEDPAMSADPPIIQDSLAHIGHALRAGSISATALLEAGAARHDQWGNGLGA